MSVLLVKIIECWVQGVNVRTSIDWGTGGARGGGTVIRASFGTNCRICRMSHPPPVVWTAGWLGGTIIEWQLAWHNGDNSELSIIGTHEKLDTALVLSHRLTPVTKVNKSV